MRFATALPAQLEFRFADDASAHGHEITARCTSAAELRSAISSGAVALAIVASSPRYLTSELLAVADDHGARLVGVAATDDDRRHAASLGLHEVADAASPWSVFESMLSGSATSARDDTPASSGESEAEPEAVRGRVITVWGPGGAPGRTTTAVTIASELAAAGQRVVLVDADTHGAAIAPTLGLLDEAPGLAAACRLAAAQRFTEDEFERIAPVRRTRSGSFRVLTGIARAGRWPELADERVRAVLDALRAWNDWVVVDTAASLERDEELVSDIRTPRRNAATLAALAVADTVVAVCAADTVGVARLLRAHPELLAACGTDRVLVLANRVRAGSLGIDPAGEVTRALHRLGGIRAPAIVPYDRAACDAASLGAVPLEQAAPRSAARQALRAFIARDLAPGLLDAPVGRGSRRRNGMLASG